MTEPAITPDLVQKHRLTPDEYTKIKEILGREPSYTELGIFSVIWSDPLCLGAFRHEPIARGAAKDFGNAVFYVGPDTGLVGKVFTSPGLTGQSAEQPSGAVLVGDLLKEKLVGEACLELLATGAVTGIQVMGAAGLTCSTCTTAARAGTGIEIELNKVPPRAPNLSSYEIMLTETPECMLVIVQQGREQEIKRIFDQRNLTWSEIGVVTNTGRMVVRHNGRIVADIPADKLAHDAPVWDGEFQEPAYLQDVRAFRLTGLPDAADPIEPLKSLLAWPGLAAKSWGNCQFDQLERDNPLVASGGDSAVLRIKSDSLPKSVDARPTSDKSIALAVAGNGVHVYLDPFEGGKAAAVEAVRNLACAGAALLGVTDHLSVTKPFNAERFWQIKERVRGLAEACRAFQTPVAGGNGPADHDRLANSADPKPMVTAVGLVEKPEHIIGQWFQEEGDAIVLLGAPVDTADPLQGLGGSAYLQVAHGKKAGVPPRCNLDQARTLHSTVLGLIQSGLVRSAHSCGEGGLAVALAESCTSQPIARETPCLTGAQVNLSAFKDVRLDALLFGETQNRVLISCRPLDAVKVVERAKLLGVPATRIGVVGGDRLVIQTAAGEFSESSAILHDAWRNSIARALP